MAFQTSRTERPDPNDLDLASGTVTRVAQQAKDLDRVSVFIDDDFAFGIALDLAIEAGLKKGMTLTAEAQRALLVRQEAFAVKAAGLRYVAAQTRTSDEVRRTLTRKGFAEALVDDAVAGLADAGLLDDDAYALAYARSRFSGRGHGPSRIRQDLMRRGVARASIDAAIEALTESEDLGARAREDAATKWRSLASEPDRRKRLKKTMDFLIRRGHAYDAARSAAEAAAEADPHEDAEDDGWQD